jgi:hypothetical protein
VVRPTPPTSQLGDSREGLTMRGNHDRSKRRTRVFVHVLVLLAVVLGMAGALPALADTAPGSTDPSASSTSTPSSTTAASTTTSPGSTTSTTAAPSAAPKAKPAPTTTTTSAPSTTTTTTPAVTQQATGSVSTDFSQCSNGKNGDQDCSWINGILNTNNSKYGEGMSVPQRILHTNVASAASHVIRFSHQYTKGGTHAFDFITSWPQASATGLGTHISFNPTIACAGLGGSTSTCTSLINGGHFLDIAVPSYAGETQDAAYNALHGTRTVRVYSDAAVTGGSFDPITISGSPAGDSDLMYSLHVTGTGTQFLVLVAGHLAVGDDGTAVSWGAGTGAGSISGGPYHFHVGNIDNVSVGNQDNQIMAGAVIPAQPQGQIAITKSASPADDTSFSFTATGSGTSGFSLSDPSNKTKTFNGLGAGTYTFTEGAASGWDLTDITCTGTATVTKDLANRTVSLDLPQDASAACTFTNVKRGSVTVTKVVSSNRNDKGSFSFPFTSNLPGAGNSSFSLSDGQSHGPVSVAPGTYSVTETLGSMPAGFALGSIHCTDTSTGDTSTGVTTIDVAPGENVTCTYTNDDIRSNLVVVKQTNPGGDPTSFGFTTDAGAPASFGLSDGQQQSYVVVGGTYDVGETAAAGWVLSGVSCNGTAATVTNGHISVNVPASATVTCTFTNTKQGTITIVKQTDPDGSTQSFGFSGDLGTFNLTDGGQHGSGLLLPGDYTITENQLAGWQLSGVACGNASVTSVANGVTVHLAAGQNVTCEFDNHQSRGSITIWKQTAPDGSSQSFDFTGDLGSFSLSDGQNHASTNLLPGTYTVSETAASGWDLTNIDCGNANVELASGGVAIDLGPGDNVVCTFTNTQRGSITIAKQVQNPLNHSDISSFGFGFDTNADQSADVTLHDGEHHDYTNLLPGDHTYTELTPPAGFSFVSLSCDDGSQASGSGVTVSLQPGEHVTCTWTNRDDRGDLTIVKQTVPNGSNQSFDFTSSAAQSGFSLSDGQSKTFTVLADDYTAGETEPAGWQLTDVSCTAGESTTHPTVTDGGITVHVPEHTHVTCTFTNTQEGSLTIVKDAGSDADGTPFNFALSSNLGAEGDQLTLTPTADQPQQSATYSGLLPGTYTATEAVPDGWSLVGLSCSDESSQQAPTASVTLTAGEHVTCTFTNASNRGTLIVQKLLDGNPAPNWTFDLTTDAPTTVDTPITTGDGGMANAGLNKVLSGGSDVTVTERIPGGYAFQSAECSDQSDAAPQIAGALRSKAAEGDGSIGTTVLPGHTVTCVFNNTTLPASIKVVKTANPTDAAPGDTVTYTYVVTNTGQVTLHDITLDDDKLGPITLDTTTLAPGESTTAHATHVVTQADADAGSIVNVATATGTSPLGDKVTDKDNATVTVTPVKPTGAVITIVKTPSVTNAKPGDTVVYTYVITNQGPEDVQDLALMDDKLGPISLPHTSLKVGESITVTASHVVTEGEVGDLVNVATVTGQTTSGIPVTATDNATVHVAAPTPIPALPFTGTGMARVAVTAAWMLGLGLAALAIARRRKGLLAE